MSWKEIVTKVDFTGSQGRTDKKKEIPEKPRNPFSTKKVPAKGMQVDHSEPTGHTPPNKCDGWPDCKNNATLFCLVCCFKGCDDCYYLFSGRHPAQPVKGKVPTMAEHCNYDEETGKWKIADEPETDEYTTADDW